MDGLVGKIISFLFGSPGFLAGGEGRSPVVPPRFAPSSWIGIARHVGITFPRQFAISIQHGEELHASAEKRPKRRRHVERTGKKQQQKKKRLYAFPRGLYAFPFRMEKREVSGNF